MITRRNSILLVQFFLLNVITVYGIITVQTEPTAVLQLPKSEVHVMCNVKPNDKDTRISWKKDNVEIKYWSKGKPKDQAFVFAGNNTLYIASLKRRVTGKYECIAYSQSSGTKVVATTTIEIKYVQKLQEIAPVKVYRGEAAKIVCQEPLAKPLATVSWEVNGTALAKTSRIDPRGWTLIINNVSLNDAGTYRCIAKNDALLRDANTSLSVIIPGVVSVTPANDEIMEGENSTFECKSTAIPPLDTVWQRSTETCVLDNCTERKSIVKSDGRFTVEGGKLTIVNALPEDKGTYKCEVSLGSQLDVSVVALNVIEKMKKDVTAHQHDQSIDIRQKSGRITCQFRGDGTYTVSWNRVNNTKLREGIIENKTTLIFNDVQFNDTGTYKCTAVGPKNTANAEIDLEVYESPVFKIKPKNVTQNEGKSAWVDCAGTGTPTPKVSYHKNGKKELNETHAVTLPNGTLFIKELKKEDYGTYDCWLTQRQSIVAESFTITVLDAEDDSNAITSPMGRTVGIAVGCACVYIVLVIVLMIYCRARRAKLLKKGLITEADDYDVKDPLVNGEDIPLETTKSLDDWHVPKENVSEISTLGHGKMGRVFKAIATTDKHPDGTLVSVKEFGNIENLQKEEFNLEVEMFLQLNHENVVKLIGVTNLNSPYYMMIEYSELGNLKDHLMNVSITQTERGNMALDIAQGMEYLVSLRYIHRDLSTRNCIAISNQKVKISFLSLCEDTFKDDYYLLNDVPVPLRWLSPEAITNESYSEKSDVWSFGVTLWEVFSGGQKPYFDYDNEQVREGVCRDLRLPLPEKCPLHVYELMKKCWIVDKNERPSFQELVSEMSESFKTGE